MSEKDTQSLSENEESEQEITEFVLDDFELNPLSSADLIKNQSFAGEQTGISASSGLTAAADLTEADSPEIADEKEIDPIFAELAAPKLPELGRENRARLQMQSPTRLYFYWSIKNNPFQVLQKAFGNTGNYQLVAKLINETYGREDIFPVEAEGNWWFNVDAASNYKAEIGFYAPNRPFVRVMFSNSVETPRKTPSPRQATEADWAVTATQFAEVLDVSGFTRDAFEVALAGDDSENAERATGNAFYQLIGKQNWDVSAFNSEEIRFALLALASGVSLAELREHISERLFAVLQENIDTLSAEKSLAALQDHFDISADEITEEEEIGAAVFGASLVNFPKSIKKRVVPKKLSPKFAPKFASRLSPVSSFNFQDNS